MGRAAWRRRKTALLIAVAFLAAGLGVLAYATHLLRRTELQTIDARFSIRGSEQPAVGHRARRRSTTRRCRNSRRHDLHSEFPFPRAYDAQRDRPPPRSRRKGDRHGHPVHPANRRSRRPAIWSKPIERAHGKVVLATDGSRPRRRNAACSAETSCSRQLGARPASARADRRHRRRRSGASRYAYNGLKQLRGGDARSGQRSSRAGLAIQRRNAADRLRRPA